MEDRFIEILSLALKLNATDIHINDDSKNLTIEFRVKGKIKKIKTQENDFKLFSYLMYLSNLDMTNQLKPKTGNFDVEVEETKLSLRLAYMKSYTTTSCVIRILNHKLELTIGTLSKQRQDIEYFSSIKNLNNGLILLSGPTGSGKTSTLYTLLKSMKDKKIFTIEDPIEIYSENLIQLAVNESINFDYDTCLKQLLRHDPDVIIIGEIRDEKTAKVALKAAITGHLVIATIHAFNSLTTILRMLDFKVSELVLSDILKGIISQRLIESDEGKYAIFEICDEMELNYYFENKHFTKNFRVNNNFKS